MLTLSSVRPGERVLAAVSGGADSVALLLLLWEERRRGRIELFAAHYEHGLRGESALRDAAFVEDLCRKLDVPCRTAHGDVASCAREWRMGVEEAARKARYQFLRQEKERLGADCIALAHHQDDQAETVLMHLLRGASLEGAAGMRVRKGDLYRPLLYAPKSEILDYLARMGQDFCTDETNLADDTPRNLLRNRAMPILETAYPGARAALGRFARWAAMDADLLAEQAAKLPRAKSPFGWVLRAGDAPAPLTLRALAACMREQEQGPDVDGSALRRALEMKSGEKTEYPGGAVCLFDKDFYILFGSGKSPRDIPAAALDPERGASLKGVCRLECRDTEGGPIRDDPWRQVLDAAAFTGCEIRTRQPGDWIQPFGMEGKKLLSDYFTDRKVNRVLRDWWPLAMRGQEALWVPGLGVSERARIGEGRRVEIACRPEAWFRFAWDGRQKKEADA